MYQAYATTVAVTNETTLASLNIGTDAAPIGEPQPLLMTGKTVTMKVQLPDGFIASTSDKVYAKHITASGDRFYDTIVTEEGGHFFATFTNPGGFSEFVFTRESLEPPTPPTGGGGGGAATYAVSAASATNGKVCVDKKNASSGSVFKPNDSLSRAQIVTMLWRLEGSPVVNYAMSFADVPSYEWFVEPVRWAQSTGVVTGYDAESFGPNDNVTREQLAAMFQRFCENVVK